MPVLLNYAGVMVHTSPTAGSVANVHVTVWGLGAAGGLLKVTLPPVPVAVAVAVAVAIALSLKLQLRRVQTPPVPSMEASWSSGMAVKPVDSWLRAWKSSAIVAGAAANAATSTMPEKE